MHVSEWLEDWLTFRSLDVKPRTLESYRDLCCRYIVPAIGGVELSDLTAVDISHMLAGIVAAGHSRTAELCYVLLHAALDDLEPNPMRRVKRPVHIQKTPDPWNDQQIRIFLTAISGSQHELAFLLALLLGLRRGEICGLRWMDIDLEAGVIHICNQRQRMADGRIVDCPPKSATSNRILPIPEGLRPLLMDKRQPSGYVCALTPSGLNRAHRVLVKSLDLPYIPLHGLRHSMATSCIRHGGDMRSLQSILGHASYSTTANIYTHPDTDMLRRALDCAGRPCYTKQTRIPLTLNQGVQGSSP